MLFEDFLNFINGLLIEDISDIVIISFILNKEGLKIWLNKLFVADLKRYVLILKTLIVDKSWVLKIKDFLFPDVDVILEDFTKLYNIKLNGLIWELTLSHPDLAK